MPIKIVCPVLKRINRLCSQWDYKIRQGNHKVYLNACNLILQKRNTKIYGCGVKAKLDFYKRNPNYNKEYFQKTKSRDLSKRAIRQVNYRNDNKDKYLRSAREYNKKIREALTDGYIKNSIRLNTTDRNIIDLKKLQIKLIRKTYEKQQQLRG